MAQSFENRIKLQETANISSASLKDINWRVKLVMSSDKYANIREPIAVVEFQLQTEDGTRKLETLEMDKNELKTFLDSLEVANKTVNQLKT
ncbi:COMM domain-containing protein 8-like [Clytia hemisphaerica]|uniref:COMM domain-containing protein 8-like n=1 Tax=Clytia hemisphaerica TaxID=252671 RepID=UPI0034D4B544